MKLPNPYTQRKLAEARELLPRNGPFAAINVGFHVTYTRVVDQVLAQLGGSVPVVVVIGDDATLLCDDREQREQVIPARYHELKALAHLAFGVQLTLMANGSGHVTELDCERASRKARTDSGGTDRSEQRVLYTNGNYPTKGCRRVVVPRTHARRQGSRGRRRGLRATP